MSRESEQTPYYDLESFLNACKEGTSAVFVRKPALEDAKVNFGMHTQKEVLAFLADKSVDEFEFKNSRKLDQNLSHIDAVADAYSFAHGTKIGFTAFFRVNETVKWQIKSLKKDYKSPLTDKPFADALAAFGKEKK